MNRSLEIFPDRMYGVAEVWNSAVYLNARILGCQLLFFCLLVTHANECCKLLQVTSNDLQAQTDLVQFWYQEGHLFAQARSSGEVQQRTSYLCGTLMLSSKRLAASAGCLAMVYRNWLFIAWICRGSHALSCHAQKTPLADSVRQTCLQSVLSTQDCPVTYLTAMTNSSTCPCRRMLTATWH